MKNNIYLFIYNIFIWIKSFIIKDSKISILNFLIIFIWFIFIYFNLISQNRLIFFFEILFLIIIYKFLFFIFKKLSRYKIKNNILILLIYFNKYRNPILLILIKLEEKIFDILCIYHNKWLIKLIYLIFLFLINPLKILFYYYYKILDLWINHKYYRLVIFRMLGLILSILIFTNILKILKYIFFGNIWIIIYLYFFIIALLSELMEKDNYTNKYINFFLKPAISNYTLIYFRLHVNLISLIISSNNIKEIFYYLNDKNQYKIEKFSLSYTWETLNSIKKYQDTPSYWFYSDLYLFLDIYLSIIVNYIYMDLNNWSIENIDQVIFNGKLDNFNITDFEKFKFIYKFDFKVFKLLLFLVYDIESYLGNDPKNIINIDYEFDFLILSCFESRIYQKEFFSKIKTNNSKFSTFNNDILINLDKYLFYFKEIKKIHRNEIAKSYQKLASILQYIEIDDLKEIRKVNQYDFINDYKKYIDDLYIEWLNISNKKEWYLFNFKFLDQDLEKINKLSKN